MLYYIVRPYRLLLGLLLFASIQVQAQDSATRARYQTQLQLVDSLRSYIADDLGMYVDSDFYTRWDDPHGDSMYTYFYYSRSDKVEKDTTLKVRWLFDKEADAVAKGGELTALGYQTLIYKTAGMSNARLTPKLLSYAPEAIAFIVFHEAVHRNLGRVGSKIHYNYEEALCDVIANLATVRFAEKTGVVDVHAAERQRIAFERSYAYLNRERGILDTLKQQDKPALFKTCTQTILSLTAVENQFVKDRMDYEVNNAYFLRLSDYALNYFRIKKLFAFSFDFKDIANRVEDLQEK